MRRDTAALSSRSILCAGATLLDGYPVEARSGSMPDAFAYTGVPSMFLAAGFREVGRRSPGRPIMRLALPPERPSR